MCPLPKLRFTTPKTAFLGGGAAEGVPSAAAERRPRKKWPPGHEKHVFAPKNALRSQAAHIRPDKPTTACRRPVIPPSRSMPRRPLHPGWAPTAGSGTCNARGVAATSSRCDQGGARAGTAAAPRRAGRAAARTTAAVAAAARAARTGATATAASRGRRRRGRGVRAQSPEAARAAPAGEQSCAAGSSPPCPAIACGQKNRPPCCWCSSTGNGGASRGGSAHPPPWMGADESA